jgi:hypothetical protein
LAIALVKSASVPLEGSATQVVGRPPLLLAVVPLEVAVPLELPVPVVLAVPPLALAPELLAVVPAVPPSPV